jgi:glycosyltransferase involved in cell wall biosynthesis
MITVHVITYNEEIMIEFFINHYRERFPNCEINIYDNYSTDRTVEIGKQYNCNIIMYDTNN